MRLDPATLGVGGVLAVLILSLLGWAVKKGLTAFLEQNKTMVDGALKNMEANTQAINANVAAIGANTEATLRHINACDVRRALEEEREKQRKEQLDRIEKDVQRIRRRGDGGNGDT